MTIVNYDTPSFYMNTLALSPMEQSISQFFDATATPEHSLPSSG